MCWGHSTTKIATTSRLSWVQKRLVSGAGSVLGKQDAWHDVGLQVQGIRCWVTCLYTSKPVGFSTWPPAFVADCSLPQAREWLAVLQLVYRVHICRTPACRELHRCLGTYCDLGTADLHCCTVGEDLQWPLMFPREADGIGRWLLVVVYQTFCQQSIYRVWRLTRSHAEPSPPDAQVVWACQGITELTINWNGYSGKHSGHIRSCEWVRPSCKCTLRAQRSVHCSTLLYISWLILVRHWWTGPLQFYDWKSARNWQVSYGIQYPYVFVGWI